jgi:hypothetical protein
VHAQSITQTLPSRSIKMPCGEMSMPSPKLFTRFPFASKCSTGGSMDPAQLLAPHRSATQTLVPSLSIVTALVAPQVRPGGILAQFSTVVYGLGRSFTGDVWGPGGAW